MVAKVIVSNDHLGDIEQSLRELANLDVLVGVPEADDARGDVAYNSTHKNKIKTGSISRGVNNLTNAELVYIQTHGVRSKEMRQEMGQMMLGPNNMPIDPLFNQFLDNMSKGMSYNAAYNLYIHEHGSPAWQIPPRPIIEPAIEDEDNKKIITEDLGEAAAAATDGKIDQARRKLQKAGMDAQNIVREWFVNPKNEWPPNAESTVKQKGSEQPLIDKGEMRKSITYVIRDKGGG